MSRRKHDDIMLGYAHKMRRQPTDAEKLLWRYLSGAKLGGYKFRRQTILDDIIADFFCPAKSLVVEIDGDTHHPMTDALRDERLLQKGIATIRVTNQDVLTNVEGVLELLRNELDRRADRWPHPNPSPEGEGL